MSSLIEFYTSRISQGMVKILLKNSLNISLLISCKSFVFNIISIVESFSRILRWVQCFARYSRKLPYKRSQWSWSTYGIICSLFNDYTDVFIESIVYSDVSEHKLHIFVVRLYPPQPKSSVGQSNFRPSLLGDSRLHTAPP